MWEYFLKGGPVMWPLLVCSFVSLTVVIERAMFWMTLRRRSNGTLLNEIMALCESGDWEAIRLRTAGTRDYAIKVIVTGILHRDFSMTKAMESAAADQVKRMRRFMGVLDTMITVAPLLGIFGTVTGIIQSFEALGATGIERPAAVTAGIAEALITTAAGLGIAIPSVILYNFFDSLCERAALRIEKYATSLEIVYEKLVRRDGPGGRP
ncbi:MAG TPA: MotA/TolQ/ExbB proton channel family protein [Desulfobacterales bacterium]|nr:MotA/TolQ/ExbB proton channel family protein [Desulfobacterales bacterium]